MRIGGTCSGKEKGDDVWGERGLLEGKVWIGENNNKRKKGEFFDEMNMIKGNFLTLFF